MINRKPETLRPLLEELASYKNKKNQRKHSVSNSDVAWQIDHSLRVFNLVSKTFLESNPKDYVSKFNKWRLLFFTLGYFPRGKVRAPKVVKSPEVIAIETINQQLEIAFQNLEKLKTADWNAHFKHFIFGVLNKPRTIRFLQLHTTHHLKIIDDILK
ncbi:DUF1569 domain-containing protein [Ichthyenterobacterium sp. W332]|uniref:DUF1569 domain-containing protein n=1 Tax=Microcosmobacter mediterraneus TaxID=3075607 RepID=A0ABU2YJ79_9FLAO|nr:DUF1569 domain-containing protein [Ichthyenterobacterium sp. W332]MDT0558233.1 DUF1569 domain-containing protein [Ichthyenterobacterium sp. W332]